MSKWRRKIKIFFRSCFHPDVFDRLLHLSKQPFSVDRKQALSNWLVWLSNQYSSKRNWRALKLTCPRESLERDPMGAVTMHFGVLSFEKRFDHCYYFNKKYARHRGSNLFLFAGTKMHGYGVYCQINLMQMLHDMFIIFGYFVNATAKPIGQVSPSSPKKCSMVYHHLEHQ